MRDLWVCVMQRCQDLLEGQLGGSDCDQVVGHRDQIPFKLFDPTKGAVF